MRIKSVLLYILIILFGFYLLHTYNPGEAYITFGGSFDFTVPVTALVFGGFILGVALMLLNTLMLDISRAIKDYKVKRERKRVEQAEQYYADGVNALLSCNMKKAAKHLEKALGLKPGNRDIIMKLSDVQRDIGEPLMASATLESALEQNPGDMEVLFRIAELSVEIDETLKAEKMFGNVLELDKSNARALKGLRDIMTAAGRWKDASGVQATLLPVEKSRDKAAGRRETTLLAAILYEEATRLLTEGSVKEAGIMAARSLDADSEFVPAWALGGDVALASDDTAGAIKQWKKGYDKTGDVIFLMNLEELFIGESNPQEIIATFKAALKKQPGSMGVRLLQARLFLRLEMVDDAIKELEQMGDEGLFEAGAGGGGGGAYQKLLLGTAYLRRRQPEKAAEMFEGALGFDKDMTPVFKCGGCGRESTEWLARCPECNLWNSFSMLAVCGGGNAGYVQTTLKKIEIVS